MENLLRLLFLCILLTCVTGTIAYVVTKCLWRISKEKNPYLTLNLLKTVHILYLVPVVFIVMCAKSVHYFGGSWLLLGDFLVGTTDILKKIFMLLGFVWCVGFLIQAVGVIRKSMGVFEVLKGNVPVDDPVSIRIFEECRAKFAENKSYCKYVELVQNDLLSSSPISVGIFRPKVVLPFETYTEKQLRILYEHELNHIMAMDIVWRKISLLVEWIYWFNPVVHNLVKEFVLMEEAVCDCRSSLENEHYTIVDYGAFLSGVEYSGLHSGLVTAFCQSGHEVFWRVNIMVNTSKMKKVTKSTILLSSMLLTVVAILPSHAVAAKASELNNKLVRSTEKENVLTSELDELVVVTEIDEGSVREIDLTSSVSTYATDIVKLDYTFSSELRVLYGYKSMAAGDSIAIAARCTDSTATYRIGIRNASSGEVTYCEGTGSLTYNFPITAAGTYSAYVQNMTTRTIDIEGSATYFR